MSKMRLKRVNSDTKKTNNGLKVCKAGRKKGVLMPVNPMMPRGYTSSQREKLREFENSIIK